MPQYMKFGAFAMTSFDWVSDRLSLAWFLTWKCSIRQPNDKYHSRKVSEEVNTFNRLSGHKPYTHNLYIEIIAYNYLQEQNEYIKKPHKSEGTH